MEIDIDFILIRILLAFLVMSFAFPVFAQEVVDAYSVVVPVENQSGAQRQVAFLDALHEVVETLVANPNVKQDVDLSVLFAHPELYVESFSYLSDPEQQDALNIVVHFDRQALSQFFPQQHTTQSQSVSLQISGVTTAPMLNAVTHYLSQINAVKSIVIQQVSADHVTVSVMLQGDISRFIQALLAGQRFVSLSAENAPDQSALRFKWVGE